MQLLEHIRHWYNFQSAMGISCGLDSEQGMNLVHIKRSPEGISISHSAHLAGLEALQQYVTSYKHAPIGVQVQGKGILVRELRKGQLTNNLELDIQQVFPTYNAQDFYASVHEGSECRWVALARREPLDTLIGALIESGVNVVQVTIGPFVFDNILQQLNVYNAVYVFDGHRIETDGMRAWLGYGFSETNKATFKTKIGTKHVEQDFLGAYAVAFQVLMGDFVTDFSIGQPASMGQMDEARQRIKFKNNMLMLLGGIFFLLIVSTFLFSYYHGRNEELQGQVGQQNTSGAEMEQQGQDIVRYEAQLKELGWNGGISKAWLLDQLGSSLDKHMGIQLTGIEINPGAERKRGIKDKVGADRRNTLVVSGRCISLDGLNAWVRSLDNTKWVKRLHMVKFGKSQAYGDEAHVFQLEVEFS